MQGGFQDVLRYWVRFGVKGGSYPKMSVEGRAQGGGTETLNPKPQSLVAEVQAIANLTPAHSC